MHIPKGVPSSRLWRSVRREEGYYVVCRIVGVDMIQICSIVVFRIGTCTLACIPIDVHYAVEYVLRRMEIHSIFNLHLISISCEISCPIPIPTDRIWFSNTGKSSISNRSPSRLDDLLVCLLWRSRGSLFGRDLSIQFQQSSGKTIDLKLASTQ